MRWLFWRSSERSVGHELEGGWVPSDPHHLVRPSASPSMSKIPLAPLTRSEFPAASVTIQGSKRVLGRAKFPLGRADEVGITFHLINGWYRIPWTQILRLRDGVVIIDSGHGVTAWQLHMDRSQTDGREFIVELPAAFSDLVPLVTLASRHGVETNVNGVNCGYMEKSPGPGTELMAFRIADTTRTGVPPSSR
jgi:hypothetical protein